MPHNTFMGGPMITGAPFPPGPTHLPEPEFVLPARPVPPVMPSLPLDRGTPSGLANGFTVGGTTRPIPADFGSVHQGDNAFTDETAQMMASSQQPMRPGTPVPWGAMPAGKASGPTMGSDPMMALAPGKPSPAVMPAAQTPGAPQGATLVKVLKQLQDSLYPSERELAADQLTACDWHKNPQVVQALVTAARADPAPMVRAGCIRALVQMQVNTIPAVTAVQALKDDADSRVRQEAEQALTAMMAAPAPQADSSVRPASVR
jgi:hypothetical protein